MNRFKTLAPHEARIIEENAIKAFSTTIPKPIQETYEDPEIIYIVKSVFPFELFPDELIIKRDRVTLITKTMPGTRRVIDMHVQDIAQSEAACGPIFGHLHVYSKLRTEESLLIERIKRKDAFKAREIIESLIVREEPRSTY